MSKDQWQKSLHLPQTDFPMRARLSQTEPEIIALWQRQDIYRQMLESKDKPKGQGELKFFLPDGPIYANGPIHIGHALNKILKDITIKYKNMRGFRADFIPSWDCHGLPIELKALGKKALAKKDSAKDKGIDRGIDRGKKGSPLMDKKGGDLGNRDQGRQTLEDPTGSQTDPAFKEAKHLRELCQKEALFWKEAQETSFKRLGVLADWKDPVLTLDPSYIATELKILAELTEKGLIYRGRKPVFWCFRLQTALAFSEAEYREDHKSPSIYVKFYMDAESQNRLNSKKPIFAPIWTTTPWTLPANAAISLHPEFEYGIYEGEKESFLCSPKLLESFVKKTGLRAGSLKLKKSFKGLELEGLKSLHPFIDRPSPLVLGEHVSFSAGTGLVHTAPGHGLEDFSIGKKYGLEEFCPIDERACFTDSAPKFLQGHFIFKAQDLILNQLKASGHLMARELIQHSYPYNPRSASPLIYRLTPQWFLSLDKPFKGGKSLRQRALGFCEQGIKFIPSDAKARLSAMLRSGPDWCLSRQRLWGVPLPALYCKACGEAILEPSVLRKSAQVIEKLGRERYFSMSASELLPKGFSCPSCGKEDFRKGEDILDVWFDSGIQHAVFAERKTPGVFPSDVFLEGQDQHRGWFQTSLLAGLSWKEAPPFVTLLTHGFVNDAKGYKMSKSRGNILRPDQLIQQSGAEILRLWTAGENYTQDIRAGEKSFQRVRESYRRFRNTFRFLLGNLKDFEPERDLLPFKDLNAVDRWALVQLNNLIEEAGKIYDEFAFYKLSQELNQFFSADLSGFYLDIIKDRLYTFSKRSLERRRAQTVLFHLTDKLLPLMAPITSFLCEEVYSYFQKPDKKQSVFLEPFPLPLSEWQRGKIALELEKFEPKEIDPGKIDPVEIDGIEEKQKIQRQEHLLFRKIFPLRQELLRQLEDLRREGKIRSSLQARAVICLERDFIRPVLSSQELEEFFSVSQIEIRPAEVKGGLQSEDPTGLKASIKAFQIEDGEKCPRCWFYSSHLNKQGLCPKCEKNLKT